MTCVDKLDRKYEQALGASWVAGWGFKALLGVLGAAIGVIFTWILKRLGIEL
jgi:hypothetical protein